ncbi:hypothetical protein Gogos_001287 [Gossypium gossypioides]|uniref:Uncharacterized protein n=1 Tax=Gossypium gossypioides TaxID=34282 RepID=A0A7J9CVJ1_GOSGO|nr:hypothetical protein [Gossypium gossypioides]
MVNQESFLEQSLAKATQQLRKLREENRQKELKEVMDITEFECDGFG